MENSSTQEEKQKQAAAEMADNVVNKKKKPIIWDCESALYDSFELKSFERQLDSAISSRTLSMPHLSDGRTCKPAPPAPTQPQLLPKKSSKISRSIHRLLRSVFRPKQTSSSSNSLLKVQDHPKDGFFVVYGKSGALTTIPELPENAADFEGLSPEIRSLVTRTASDRFTPTPVSVSCA